MRAPAAAPVADVAATHACEAPRREPIRWAARPLFRDRAGRVLAGGPSTIELADDVVRLARTWLLPVGHDAATTVVAPLDVFVVRNSARAGHEQVAMGAHRQRRCRRPQRRRRG